MVGWEPQNKGPGMLRGQSLIMSMTSHDITVVIDG